MALPGLTCRTASYSISRLKTSHHTLLLLIIIIILLLLPMLWRYRGSTNTNARPFIFLLSLFQLHPFYYVFKFIALHFFFSLSVIWYSTVFSPPFGIPPSYCSLPFLSSFSPFFIFIFPNKGFVFACKKQGLRFWLGSSCMMVFYFFRTKTNQKLRPFCS